MAVWQYGFYFAKQNAEVSKELEPQILDAAAQDFEKHLRRVKSWHSAISAWGDPSGDHIEISRLSTGLGEIRVRVDVRNIDEALLTRIVEMANRLDCLFVTTDDHVVPAKVAKLLAQIRLSLAQRFVEDPEAYFREIAEAETDGDSPA